MIWVGVFLFPAASIACSFSKSPTDSLEPVTIKIGDTYLQIPEAAIEFSHLRTPMERNSLHLLNFDAPRNTDYAGALYKKAMSSSPDRELELSDDLVFVKFGVSPLSDEDILYLKSSISKNPPATWERDQYLVKRLRLGKSPCENGSIIAWIGELLADQFRDYSQDVIEGLQHRNQAIRKGAALMAIQQNLRSDKIRQLLLKLAKDDKVASVRHQASTALGHIARQDPSLIPDMRDIMKNGKDSTQRRAAAWNLASIDPNFVQFAVPLIQEADTAQKDIIRESLAMTISADLRHSIPSSDEQFSANSREAIKALMSMLFASSDEGLQSSLIQNLSRYGSAADVPEFIAYLNKVTLEDNLNLAYVAVFALKNMGRKPDNIEQVISRFESGGEKYIADNIKRELRENK